jgi:hypothetical protein
MSYKVAMYGCEVTGLPGFSHAFALAAENSITYTRHPGPCDNVSDKVRNEASLGGTQLKNLSSKLFDKLQDDG